MTNNWKKANIYQNGTDFLYERTSSFMENTALTDGIQKIKYKELYENIFQYACMLQKLGITKDDVIGICIENTIEGVYLLYALKIIGATTLGLSIFNNPYKMHRDIEMVKPSTIITNENFYPLIKESSETLKIRTFLLSKNDNKNIAIPNLLEIVKRNKDHELKKEAFSKDNIDTIIFTGGSTGVHKGVALNDKGLNAIANSLDEVFILEPGMTHLGNIPFGHMIFGQFTLHYALSHGLTYYLTTNSLPNDFLKDIIRIKANGAMGGPVHWQNLIDNPILEKDSIPFLIQAGSGGETLKYMVETKTNKALKYGGSKAEVLNMLGLTEMSGLTHIRDIHNNHLGTVGYPISCIKDIVVDPKIIEQAKPGEIVKLEEVPLGEKGLLLTTGESRLLCYYKNPEETQKVLVFDGKEIWYNTGDLVTRISNTKEIEFAGRKKRNFVCNYDNIYPEQVEEKVLEIPEIKEVTVTKVPDDTYQFLPVYHIALQNPTINKDVVEQKINVQIEGTLGVNALPGYIIYYEELPKKQENKKLDVSLMEENGLKLLQDNKLVLVKKM